MMIMLNNFVEIVLFFIRTYIDKSIIKDTCWLLFASCTRIKRYTIFYIRLNNLPVGYNSVRIRNYVYAMKNDISVYYLEQLDIIIPAQTLNIILRILLRILQYKC